jgi:hypothetical protein
VVYIPLDGLMMRLKTQLAIKADFEALPPRAWSRKDVELYLKTKRDEWGAPKYLNTAGLIHFLVENDIARVGEICSKEYGRKSRYVLGDLSTLQFALSFYKNSYLSHASALHVHGFAASEKIYVNREQTPKKTTSRLSQRAIDQAFRNQPRRSAFEFTIRTTTITFLNGKSTGNAGVIDLPGPGGEPLRTTSLERALIDCVVRPQYAGGILAVAQTYRAARAQVSVSEIVRLLGRTKYAYPYHQAVGFLLEKSGADALALAPLRKLGIRFNFYLEYGMKQPAFDPVWRIHYPSDLR